MILAGVGAFCALVVNKEFKKPLPYKYDRGSEICIYDSMLPILVGIFFFVIIFLLIP
jgi:hypothetical protein